MRCDTRTRTDRTRSPLPLTRRQVRVALGVLWLVDAVLQAQPVFFGAAWWRVQVAQSVMGEPPWVADVVHAAIAAVADHAALADAGFVALQGAIGIALVTDRFARAAITVSVPYALGVWWVGEGLGLLPTGFALAATGAPGPAPLYPLLGLVAWPVRPTGTDVAPGGPPVPGRVVATRAATAAWVALWAGQAVLHAPWVYPPGQVLSANLQENAIGAPSWLVPLARHVRALVGAHPVAATVALGAVEVAVGLGALTSATRPGALAIGLAASAVFWVAAQDFGGALVGGGTDPGTAPLVFILGLTLWPPRSRREIRTVVIRPAAGSEERHDDVERPHDRQDGTLPSLHAPLPGRPSRPSRRRPVRTGPRARRDRSGRVLGAGADGLRRLRNGPGCWDGFGCWDDFDPRTNRSARRQRPRHASDDGARDHQGLRLPPG